MSLEDKTLTWFWPVFLSLYLIICDLIPLVVIMQSVKPAPNRKKQKKIPIPELSMDDQDTVIDVIDYRQ